MRPSSHPHILTRSSKIWLIATLSLIILAALLAVQQQSRTKQLDHIEQLALAAPAVTWVQNPEPTAGPVFGFDSDISISCLTKELQQTSAGTLRRQDVTALKASHFALISTKAEPVQIQDLTLIYQVYRLTDKHEELLYEQYIPYPDHDLRPRCWNTCDLIIGYWNPQEMTPGTYAIRIYHSEECRFYCPQSAAYGQADLNDDRTLHQTEVVFTLE